MVKTYREFWRGKNKISIRINLDEWPSDVPLPSNYSLAKTGDETFKPFWTFYLEDDMTVEKIVGWFAYSSSLEDVVEAFHTSLKEKGWLEDSKMDEGRFSDRKWLLTFKQQDLEIKLRISMQFWEELNETTAMVERTHIHPYVYEVDED